ncbi:hypothetical protein NA56DRAFT_644640 [Hyaloscypha hepaticicola]|uniref:Secreted protein n=1 Tax=Hyaloscypha hepaticicola TaxID=2082293 RepID=A0A2J6Q9W7_9HELO|nr:hypothetical protein NA56DRAFT_644640 [Hyaloscypha hepaticicola]
MQQKALLVGLVALFAPFPCALPSPPFAQGRPFCSAICTGPIRGPDRSSAGPKGVRRILSCCPFSPFRLVGRIRAS